MKKSPKQNVKLDKGILIRPVDIFAEEQKPFIEIVDKILAITNSSDYLTNQQKQAKIADYEKQIDQLVYKNYDLHRTK